MNTAAIDIVSFGVLCACIGFVGGVFFAAWFTTTGGDTP